MIDKKLEGWVIKCYDHRISPIKVLEKKHKIKAYFVGGLLKHVPEQYIKSVIPVRGGHVVITGRTNNESETISSKGQERSGLVLGATDGTRIE